MSNLREAAQQALEALANCTSEYGHRCTRCDSEVDEGGKAVEALRAALAEYDKDRVKVEEMKANWALQRKLSEETQERDKQQREYEEQRLAALAEPVQEPVQEPVAYKSDTVCALCAREIALEAETAPFGCVTVRRLSLRHENHADQYQFYPAGQSPYLDNVDECHTVYTAPPQRKENT